MTWCPKCGCGPLKCPVCRQPIRQGERYDCVMRLREGKVVHEHSAGCAWKGVMVFNPARLSPRRVLPGEGP